MEKLDCPKCGKKFDTKEALEQHNKDKHSISGIKPQGIKVKLSTKRIGIYALIILVIAGIGYGIYSLAASSPNIGAVGSTHTHQDFKVYIYNKAVGFSQPKYQLRSPYVHVENGIGDVIHKHATGVTIGLFLKTLGISFDRNCLIMDTGGKYCNEESKSLKFYVNGKPNNQFDKYDMQDLDKILISYGDDTQEQIQAQLKSITNLAPKESGKIGTPEEHRD